MSGSPNKSEFLAPGSDDNNYDFQDTVGDSILDQEVDPTLEMSFQAPPGEQVIAPAIQALITRYEILQEALNGRLKLANKYANKPETSFNQDLLNQSIAVRNTIESTVHEMTNVLLEVAKGAPENTANETRKNSTTAENYAETMSILVGRIQNKIDATEQAKLNAMAKKSQADAQATQARVTAGASANGVVPDRKMVIRDGIKPKVLKLKHSPAELTRFEKQFKAYYEALNLDLASVPNQQAYLCAVLEDNLTRRINETTPIFRDLKVDGHVSCFSILEKRSSVTDPLLVRRMKLLSLVQTGSFDEFFCKLVSLRREADIDNMGPDDLMIAKITTGISDSAI